MEMLPCVMAKTENFKVGMNGLLLGHGHAEGFSECDYAVFCMKSG